MTETTVESFEEFKMKLRKTLNFWKIEHEYKANPPLDVIYRGQPSSKMKLEATLERSSTIKSMREYFQTCLRVNPVIEAEIEKSFDRIKIEAIDEWCENIGSAFPTDLLWYEYITFLRHHGFPSPILDWTQSLNIALGFAFFDEDIKSENESSEAKYRSIFIYIERPGIGKGFEGGETEVRHIGPYIKTDRRHFLQQSNYTVCYRKTENDLTLSSYAEVKEEFGGMSQDVVHKFNIPEKERIKILRFLYSVNITPYSLMPSTENLMRALWIKEYLLRMPDSNKFG